MFSDFIVSKFGGSSMADAACMLRSARIVAKYPKNRVVVVSATYGTTNKLEKLAALSVQGERDQTETLLKEIEIHHIMMAGELQADAELIAKIQDLIGQARTISKGMELLKECSPRAMDSLYSIGERMSSSLFTQAMNNIFKEQKLERVCQCFDSRTVIKTDDLFGCATPLIDEISTATKQIMGSELADSQMTLVCQGFIGSCEDGSTTTLGRGGSDYTGSLLSEALDAKALYIWTDVAGVASADPRIVDKAEFIAEMSYWEAAEMANMGAKVLHPATLTPVIRKSIPVFVGSSHNDELGGTWIRRLSNHGPKVRAITLKRNQCLITLTNPRMLHAHGFLKNVLDILDDKRLSIDLITTSEIGISFTLNNPEKLSNSVVKDLTSLGELKIDKNLCMVSLVGNDIAYYPELTARTFQCVGRTKIRMIALGASKHNMCFLVNSEDADGVLKRLHKNFVEGVPLGRIHEENPELRPEVLS